MKRSKTRRKNLGFGFTEEVAKVTLENGHFKKLKTADWIDQLLPNFNPGQRFESESSTWTVTLFIGISLILFSIVFFRLFHLQVVQGKQNRELADGNRIRVKLIHAPRGVIFDRNGKILASNAPGFRLLDSKTQKPKLITREESLELEVKNDPSVAGLEVDNIRTYPMGEKTAHLVGYVGEVSQEELSDPKFRGAKSGDWIGKTGIEAQYDTILRGTDGGEIIEVDSKDNKLRTLRRVAPIAGENIYLTIDNDLQKVAYDSMQSQLAKTGSCCAGAIAQDPRSGQILALVSLPSFDPNLFTYSSNDSALENILTRSDSPILNRAIAGTYPPGSTYKIISSIAALSSGKVTPQTIVEDSGVTYLGPFKFSNWYFSEYGKTEGSVDLVKAIRRSNDTYFYRIGQMIGENALIDWSKKLYLGRRLGIDLPGEAKGLVPDHAWKDDNIGEPWYPGDTLHMAIGQGFLLTTPLQILGITSFIATDGVMYKPQLVLKITDGDKETGKFSPEILISNLVPSEHLAYIKEGLEEVTKEGGTAWPFFSFPVSTAGKTGTAEFGHPQNKTHAWYTSYAPADDPKIAMVVLVEAGGEGSSIAGPIIKDAYRWFLSPDKNHLLQDIYQVSTASARQQGE